MPGRRRRLARSAEGHSVPGGVGGRTAARVAEGGAAADAVPCGFVAGFTEERVLEAAGKANVVVEGSLRREAVAVLRRDHAPAA